VNNSRQRTASVLEGWRLALGTFTAIPTAPPEHVDTARAGVSLLLAPFAFGMWAAGVGALLALGDWIGIDPLPLAAIGVAVLVLGNRAFHLDGLADTVDGLASSYSQERSLEVARLGNVGPAGVAAITLVLLIQVTAGASVLTLAHGPWVFAALAACSRAAAALTAVKGVGAARPEGLGATFAGSVPRVAAFGLWVLVLSVVAGLAYLSGVGLTGPLAFFALSILAVAALVHRCIQRFGGIIGDAMGASIEIVFAILLVGFTI
jgi:adenosylcobinamide-GDP ribazoletransferase